MTMTMVYAIADRTVADEYFAVSEKVEALYDRGSLPADAEGTQMLKLRREMHSRMLGNGHCARPVEMDCHFETICESCIFFVTTIEFRPTLQRQRDDAATGRLVWAAPGRDRKTLAGFFTVLGETRCAVVTHVSADAAQWIADEVAAHCPNAVRCADPFHIVAWAGDALDVVRRDTWNAARKGGMSVHARDLKGARYALWKAPENLTGRQQAKLAWVAKVNHQLYRAYLIKEQLLQVFALKGEEGRVLLERWLGWARRCRIPAFVELARRIAKHREAIDATLEHRLSNGLVESTNTKIRLLTRMPSGSKARTR